MLPTPPPARLSYHEDSHEGIRFPSGGGDRETTVARPSGDAAPRGETGATSGWGCLRMCITHSSKGLPL